MIGMTRAIRIIQTIANLSGTLLRRGVLCASAILLFNIAAIASYSQTQQAQMQKAGDPWGDVAANPGPLATDLSPALKSRDVRKAMSKVADWQLRTAEDRFSLDWTFAALYDGLLAASRTTGDPRSH